MVKYTFGLRNDKIMLTEREKERERERERARKKGRERVCVHDTSELQKLSERGMLSTVDLLTKVACFAAKINNIFNIEKS